MLEVGIVGAGVGGLSSGIMLKSIGCKVTIFEKSIQKQAVGVGIQISANGVRALREFGLEEKIAELGNLPQYIDCENGRTGERLAKVPLGKTAENLYDAGFYQCHRNDFVSLLRNENLKLGVTISFGTTVLDVRQDSEGVVVNTSKGCSRFDLLVAADGINSTVRKRVFEKKSPTFLNQVAYRTVIAADELPNSFTSSKTRLFLGAGKHVVSYPIRNGSLVNFVFCVELKSYCPESWSRHATSREIEDKFSDFVNLKEVFKKIVSAKKWGLFEHSLLKTWHKKRVVLLGDSCHPILPYLAQGATQAIEDAYELCIRVRESFDNRNLELALRKYSDNRVPRVGRVGKASKLNATLFHLKSPILVFVFHLILKTVGLVYPKLLLKRFSWLYSGGPS